ncbi:minor capsid protein [Capybara microvirus Cap3_SP_469]|nr:minor capsid protein [Capybara microvirus Cap3_SP_469]
MGWFDNLLQNVGDNLTKTGQMNNGTNVGTYVYGNATLPNSGSVASYSNSVNNPMSNFGNGSGTSSGGIGTSSNSVNDADLLSMAYDLNNESNMFNSAEAQKNRDWQEYMSNTSHQREVQDLIKAGLNPVLSAGGVGASTPSGSSASSQNVAGSLFNLVGSLANANAMQAAAAMSANAMMYSTNSQSKSSTVNSIINAALGAASFIWPKMSLVQGMYNTVSRSNSTNTNYNYNMKKLG